MAWGINHAGWWGEGEIKFCLDGDGDFPTIAGAGTEDYFCGSYDFINPMTHQYEAFSHDYSGMPQVIRSEDRGRASEVRIIPVAYPRISFVSKRSCV